ncbi:MAG: Cystathionine beta-lyase [Phycisphaerales bacterium]|nr:Cystathionine beta-lyase [Phycisphaerales bacterium]
MACMMIVGVATDARPRRLIELCGLPPAGLAGYSESAAWPLWLAPGAERGTFAGTVNEEFVNEDFEFALSADALRHSESFKWSHYPADVLPLWVADMDFAVAPSVLEKLHARLDQSIGYAPHAADCEFTRLLRAKLERQGLVDLPANGWIKYLGNVVSGLYATVMALTAPSDEVITFTPIYPPFLTAITDPGRVAKHVALAATPNGYQIDWKALEAAVTPATRLVLLCNPHNPTGRVWTRQELTRLAEFVERHRLWIITDELHADLTLDGTFTPFTAVASPAVRERTLTVTGPCKAYNTAGLGIGALISHSTTLNARVAKKTVGIAAHPSALAVTMWQATLEDDGAWLAAVLKQLRSNRDYLAAFVREKLPGVKYLGSEATYLAWLDYRSHPRAADIQQYLLKTAKVALNPGPHFGPGNEGFVRLNFATSRTILAEALDRLAAAHVPVA